MLSILRFTVAAAVAAAFKSSASAFPYTQPHFGQPVLGDNPTKRKPNPTTDVSARGKGGKKGKS